MPFLVWDSPNGRVVKELDRTIVVIGRDHVSDFCIPDPTVSRRHALVQVEGDSVRITDLGSTSKTKINGAGLVPDLPSTLEPGDFVHLGKVLLSYHVAPPPRAAPAPPPAPVQSTPPTPPAQSAPPPPAAPRPPRKPAPQRAVPARARAPAPVAGGDTPWKWVALVLAFVLVGVAGAFVALHLADDEKEPITVRLKEPAGPEPKPPPAKEKQPDPQPKPPAPKEPGPKGPERAAAGALPPRGFVPVKKCPDLLEVDGERYHPVRLRDWNASRIEALGADDKLYVLARGQVTKIEDRTDLARRAALKRAALAPDDADGRLRLAEWCVARYVRSEARRLVDELLKIRPGDARALALKATLMESE